MKKKGLVILGSKLKPRTFLFLLGIVYTLFLIEIVGAGFGSSYLPNIDGKPTFVVKPGIERSYFIHPQNLDDEVLYVKIELTDEENIVIGELEDFYEIPPNTRSDDFKIELKIKVPRDAELGTKYPIKYRVLSSREKSEEGMVSFSPVGYDISFIVLAGELEKTYIWLWIMAVCISIAVLISLYIRRIRRRKLA